jgi:cystathionine gamma-synthase
MPDNSLHSATLAAQALGWTDASTGALVIPLHTATTFERDPDNQYRRGYSYARAGSAAYAQPQAVITALEGGAATLLFASGMAAATTVFRVLPLGAHVVVPLHMYHSLRRWFAAHAAEGHITADFVDVTSLDALRHAMCPSAPASSGSKPRRIRSGRSPTLPVRRSWRMRPAHCSQSTAPRRPPS